MTNIDSSKQNLKYGLKPINREHPYAPIPVNKKRIIIGRSENCDVVIPFRGVSMVHAVLEVTRSIVTIYDMNSKTHTYVNGEIIVNKELKIGDILKFGNYEYYFDDFLDELVIPPVLNMLKNEIPKVISKSSYVPSKESIPSVSVNKKVASVKIDRKLPVSAPAPVLLYPLAKDPNADECEYIFEDSENLYPIISYDIAESALEVIILYKDNIHSVDYLPKRDAAYFLAGYDYNSVEVEYPVLSKDDRFPFVEIVDGDVFVKPIPGHELFVLADDTTKGKGVKHPGESVLLGREDIIRMTKNDVQIFIRATAAPPYIKGAPFLRRDADFKKYLLIMLFFIFTIMTSLSVYDVDEELEKEKAPERIATILFNKKKLFVSKNKAIAKTKDAQKKIQKAPQSSVKKKVEAPKTAEKKQVEKKIEKRKEAPVKVKNKVNIVKKATPNKAKQDRKSPVVVPKTKTTKTVKNVTATKPKKVTRTKRPSKSKVVSTSKVPNRIRKKVNLKVKVNRKSKGHVQAYKSFDFASNMSSLLAKGGSVKASSASARSATVESAASSSASSASSATLRRAKTSGNIGSLTGAARGKLESSSKAGSLVSKKGIFHAGMPFKTVVLGGLDPNDIRRILAENIDKFRYCYQRVLDSADSAFDGIVTMDFIIGASGHVTRAAVKKARGLPGSVKKCVVNVLKGIRFPEPPGGGVVEVIQPFNFYPEIR